MAGIGGHGLGRSEVVGHFVGHFVGVAVVVECGNEEEGAVVGDQEGEEDFVEEEVVEVGYLVEVEEFGDVEG